MRSHLLRAAGGGVEVDRSWDLEYALFTGTPQNWFAVSSQEATPTGLFFKSDGTKMYIVGSISDAVHEYSLSSAWEPSSAVYVQSFSVASQETIPSDLAFSSDGTKMYVIGVVGDDVNEYSLSSAWDISTASYTQNFSVASQETNPLGLHFKGDGTKMYIVGTVNDTVYEYTLSTAWDVSTASYIQGFSVNAQDTAPTGVFFKSDGTVMYVLGDSGNDVNQYSLSTAWDVSTASYVQNFSVGPQDSSPNGLFFKSDGTKMYIVGANSDAVWEYSLSTPWDISTASFVYPSNDYFSVVAEETVPAGLFFKSDGTKMYIVGAGGDDVNEYNLSTAWQISTASYVQAFSVVAQESVPTALFFKSDGTKMYVIGYASDSVNEYNLSSAWDVSTASYLQNFSVATQEANPYGLFFKGDGTKMYTIGFDADSVLEYSLSTAWDVSSASYVQGFSVAAQSVVPAGVFFKDDGTKMYVSNPQFERIDQYNLSTAWDISTASYDLGFPILLQETNVRSTFFKPDGTKFFLTGATNDAVWAFSIS